MPSEEQLLRDIARRSASIRDRHPHVLVGPGDDCAVVRTASPDARLVLSVDQLVEGRHFDPGTPADLIARKAVARAVSDLAAMAARPSWSLAAGVIPSNDPRAAELCERLAHWGEHFGVPVVGGDLATLPGSESLPRAPLVLSITVAGEIDPHTGERPVLRTGARPGDGLYVTGRIGNSYHSGRHLTFTPRVREALALRSALGERLHAMIDVSDGVGRDAGRLARSGGVEIRIDGRLVPLHADARGRAGGGKPDPDADLREALADGEDYELLFAAAGDVPAHLPPTDPADAPTPVTRIGVVAGVAPGVCTLELADGRTIDASELGWEHR